ncbi:MAG: DUF6517 family protein, partial [Natronomonas sp.]
MKRRDVLVGTGAAVLGGLAGCLGTLGMDEHESAPASVEEPVRDETEYELVGVEPMTIVEEFSAAGSSEEVRVTNHSTDFEKTVEMGPLGEQEAAVFSVLTTPQISLFGREFNPVADMSTEELAEMIADDFDEIENITHDLDDTVTILDQETTRSRFEADSQFGGQDVEVYIHVTESVETSTDDFAVAVGVYPQEFHDDEGENTVAMMEGVIDDADIDVENGSSDDDGETTDDDDGETTDDD